MAYRSLPTLGLALVIVAAGYGVGSAESPPVQAKCGGNLFTVQLGGFTPSEIERLVPMFVQMRCYGTRARGPAGADYQIIYEIQSNHEEFREALARMINEVGLKAEISSAAALSFRVTRR